MQRAGTFSSSEIYRLIPGKKGNRLATGDSYIQEKLMEIRLGRALNSDSNAKPTNWGSFIEKRAFDLIGTNYRLVSEKRLVHPYFTRWTGAPDCVTDDSVVDIKSPFTLKAFCEGVDCKTPETLKEAKPEYFWQQISNSILTGKKYAELIYYVPYQEELSEIRDMANMFEGDMNKVAFINFAPDDQLPYLIKGNYYKNINILKWEVREADKILLTESVKSAIEELESLL